MKRLTDGWDLDDSVPQLHSSRIAHRFAIGNPQSTIQSTPEAGHGAAHQWQQSLEVEPTEANFCRARTLWNEFGLLEDFDHLYRYANLMDMLEGKKAEKIVQQLTEVMPGRPTIDEHRHPFDDVRKPLKLRESDPRSALHALTVTAAEQQTMNFYMNIGNRPMEKLARGLYMEIGMIEEQHVTHYESMQDASATWAEMLVLHEYNECYLYYSFMQTEVDPRLKRIWELHLDMELEHLRLACELMKKVDGKDPAEILPKELPEPVTFRSNRDYVRRVLESQVNLTGNHTEFVPVSDLPENHRYHQYREVVHDDVPVPSEQVIAEHRQREGGEYRVEPGGPHPLTGARAAE